MVLKGKRPLRKDQDDGLARRDFLKTCISASTGAILPAVHGEKIVGQGDRAVPRRPNILYLHSHDTGRYIQPYGYAIPTPNLQRLADEGILFRQAFSAAPTCSPSRAGLLTGMCPHRNGMLGLAHRGFSLNDYHQHILHTLRREAGYSSALIGIQHIAQDPAVIGYDKVGQFKGNHVEQVAPAAAEFLTNSPPQPFFLDVGFFETHRPFRAPGPQDDPRHSAPPAPVPDTPQTRLDMAGFQASARALDWGMGVIMKALETSGLAENTLVIATTDHGIAFPRMKCNLYDTGMGVRLMMRGPGGFNGGKVSDAMISQLDLFPTLCDLLQIEPPRWLEGKSFMPVLQGKAEEINEAIFAEVNYHAAYEPARAVRTRRWKYIRRFDGRAHPVLPNCDDGPSKELWLQHGWRDQPVAAEEFYDLIFDPNEVRNLIHESAAQSELEKMRARLNQWMQSTDDPLLHGPVKAPRGAFVNDPDQTSPQEPVHTVI